LAAVATERISACANKSRGANVKNYKLDADGSPWLVANVLPIWNGLIEMPRPVDKTGWVTRDYKQFVTIGSALSPGRWKLAGRWSPDPGEADAYKRSINVHELGVKRILNLNKPDDFLNDARPGGRPAKRTYSLIATIPTINFDLELSRSRPPKWVDEETGEIMEEAEDFDDVAAGSRLPVEF
jgi:hypothetical protein